MDLVVVGLNHRTASIDIRERLAFPEDRIEEALRRLRSVASAKECMILSTCNRVEIYAVCRGIEEGMRDLKEFLSFYHKIPLERFEQCLYCLRAEEAVSHVFRVASSLDSMVLGEPQILGQIKEAHEIATRAKTSGVILNRLLTRAFRVAKRVRTETAIGSGSVSVSSVAVELARKIFESLENRIVLLIGAGEMCELAARHLVSGGVKKVLVTNRTHERALAFAQIFKGDAIPFEEIERGLKLADIVISATGSPGYLLRREQVTKVMRERKQRPIFFIDIADPRDIEPKVGEIENVYLYNIDDLRKVAEENAKGREKEARKAELIVEEEVGKFVRWYRSLDVTPTIVSLKEKFEYIRKKELEKMLSIHPELDERERKSLEALTTAIVNKILHDPISVMKTSDSETPTDLYADALRVLFKLPDKAEKSDRDPAKIETGDSISDGI